MAQDQTNCMYAIAHTENKNHCFKMMPALTVFPSREPSEVKQLIRELARDPATKDYLARVVNTPVELEPPGLVPIEPPPIPGVFKQASMNSR